MGLRAKFWDHMLPLMDPELAGHPAAPTSGRDRGRPTIVPFEFDTHPDGAPILTNIENGEKMKPNRMREVLRLYIRDHYGKPLFVKS